MQKHQRLAEIACHFDWAALRYINRLPTVSNLPCFAPFSNHPLTPITQLSEMLPALLVLLHLADRPPSLEENKSLYIIHQRCEPDMEDIKMEGIVVQAAAELKF